MGGGRALTESLPAGVLEIRSIRVGVVALKAVHSGFYVAMNRLGRLYGSVSGSAEGGRGCEQRCAGACPGACPGPLTAHPAAVLRCALQVPGAYRGEWLQHLCVSPLAPPRPAHVPGSGRSGRPEARGPHTATPPVHALPARPGLLSPRVSDAWSEIPGDVRLGKAGFGESPCPVTHWFHPH